MRRPRKRHEQLSIEKVERTPDKNGQWRGGKREGAGRKPAGKLALEPHVPRPWVVLDTPLHVTLRIERAVGRLRGDKAYRAIRCALRTVLKHHAQFRIVHFSLQREHIHLICEAESKDGLETGMRSFEIAAAKHLNRELTPKGHKRRRGRVIADRYHIDVIDSVARMRNALSYVLNNWRKHREDRVTRGLFGGRIDPYSSGVFFLGWKERKHSDFVIPPNYEPPDLGNAHSWLLTTGYRRGKPIGVFDVPGVQNHLT
jgi:REP element-mobilizing transposase RayT